MYKNTYSDYAANKTDAEAIVCRSATAYAGPKRHLDRWWSYTLTA